ncbi:helix-turn-helix domain-containing protein [Shewanella sp. UCD-KL12]|uniref:helix-turn-helix domain-containing protein n=1 Tax=Shewanella sp. UCD-KL12 TaxID=1917163 RepID=UPI0009712B43|nr:helix-turn-helix domain-containing protein [Shewanella sp. UCD-KL12]
MTLGQQLKQFRTDRGFSQPELAELAGIEQSYLSKLENDKSVPSNDTFRALLSALTITVEQFIHSFDLVRDRKQLIQIPDIELKLSQKERRALKDVRRYLYMASTLIILGVTLFYTGFGKQLFNESRYQYISPGIILAGEPNDIFHSWHSLINTNTSQGRAAINATRVEIAKRKYEVIKLSQENRGQLFVENSDMGKRQFRLDKVEQIPRAINAWLQIFGVLLFCGGIMGFVLEKRLNN